MSNRNRTVIYIGVTNDISRRLKEDKSGNGAYFTKRYNVFDLIYLEEYEEDNLARAREKQLKNWHKEWKWNLVKKSNPKLETLIVQKRP